MSIDFTKTNTSIESQILDYQKGLNTLKLIEAKMARAASRIERANRLRASLPDDQLKVMNTALMAVSCQFEADSYKEMTILPYIKKEVQSKIADILNQLNTLRL